MDNKTKRQIQGLLVKAYALLRRGRGWGQGNYDSKKENGTHCYCALGAIHQASTQIYDGAKLQDPAAAVLQRQLPKQYNDARIYTPGGAIITYNDKRSTRYSDIALAFRKAILSLEA